MLEPNLVEPITGIPAEERGNLGGGASIKILRPFVFSPKQSKEGTVRRLQIKEASLLWSHQEETRELPGERDNARNNVRCKQARKTTHARPGWTTSRRGQDSPWKSQSE